MTNEKAIEAVARIVSRVMGRDNYALAMQTAHEIVYLLNYEAAKPVAEPVAWVQREVLDELRRHKDATATVASGLLKKPFGNPVALYALSAPASNTENTPASNTENTPKT